MEPTELEYPRSRIHETLKVDNLTRLMFSQNAGIRLTKLNQFLNCGMISYPTKLKIQKALREDPAQMAMVVEPTDDRFHIDCEISTDDRIAMIKLLPEELVKRLRLL